MRRKDREVARRADIIALIARSKVCRLGMWDGREVYMTPMNFGYEERDGELYLYFHGAREGRRADILRERPQVAFQMDGGHELLTAATPCLHSYAYYCVMGQGLIEMPQSPTEKSHALAMIMRHQTGGTP